MQAPHRFTNINSLPLEILNRIFAYLDYDDIIRLRVTCWLWKHLLDSLASKTEALSMGHYIESYRISRSCVTIDCGDQRHMVHNLPVRQSLSRGTRRITIHRQAHIGYKRLCGWPINEELQTFVVDKLSYTKVLLSSCSQTLTILSLGFLDIDEQLLDILLGSLPNLEHFELIRCSSQITYSATTSDDSRAHPRHNYLAIRNSPLVCRARQNRHFLRLRHLVAKDSPHLCDNLLGLIIAACNKRMEILHLEQNPNLTGTFLEHFDDQTHLKTLVIIGCWQIPAQSIDDFLRLRQVLLSGHEDNLTVTHRDW